MRMFLLCCLVGASLTTTSCSSDEESNSNGSKGSIQLSVTADAAFGTGGSSRAVNESTYTNTDEYTIQILDDKQTVKTEFLYKDTPTTIQLDNGSYTLKAFYGSDYKDNNASRDGFYVEGESSFSINGDNQQIKADCYPTCGKLVVSFADNMATYFSNYYVEFQTAALKADGNSKAVWQAGDTDPYYAKLDKNGEKVTAVINYTRVSDGVSKQEALEYEMKPNKQWTLTLVPKDDNGNMGIEIVIDATTNDKPVDIEVPSDWI